MIIAKDIHGKEIELAFDYQLCDHCKHFNINGCIKNNKAYYDNTITCSETEFIREEVK